MRAELRAPRTTACRSRPACADPGHSRPRPQAWSGLRPWCTARTKASSGAPSLRLLPAHLLRSFPLLRRQQRSGGMGPTPRRWWDGLPAPRRRHAGTEPRRRFAVGERRSNGLTARPHCQRLFHCQVGVSRSKTRCQNHSRGELNGLGNFNVFVRRF
jgi:hypothetical protein